LSDYIVQDEDIGGIVKKMKTIIPFSFKEKTKQQMVDYLNDRYPISIKHNEDLVNRVHARYPLLNRSEVAIVIRTIFVSIRDLLVLGNILNFNGLFFDAKLHFFPQRVNGQTYPALKVHVSTPPPLR
jgi:hypothetical protein